MGEFKGYRLISHSGIPKTGSGSAEFQFTWTAPTTSVGEVTFYAAGNAANSNSLETGDFIYTTSLTVQAAGPVTGIEELGAPVPQTFALHGNFPNPFNPSTTLRYSLPAQAPVTLTVFDLLGREVVRLIDGPQPAGTHQAAWDGRDRNGQVVAGGVYLARLMTPGAASTRKMLLLK